jgi:phosphoglycerate dehydrogenase-like enzyme
MAESTARPRVVMLIPAARQSEVLTAAAMARLHAGAEVVGGDLDASEIAASLPALLADADACLTGWGTPPLTELALAGASHLRLIAHAAGSVKRLIPPGVFERGIVVSHVSSVMADAVAEYTILAILLGLRRVHEMDRSMKAGVLWHDPAIAPQWQLAVRTVGLVGMGYVGRRVVRLLNAFGPRLQVFDPYLSAEDAAALGVESVSLDDVFRDNEIVSVHAPITPETHHLVGARQLALLRDGAIFINCARSWVVDPDALLATLQTGRIWAALDVFDREPLSLDSPLRKLPNVLLTPHEAGHTVDTYQRQGDVIVDEIERFFRGDALQHQISPERFALMA